MYENAGTGQLKPLHAGFVNNTIIPSYAVSKLLQIIGQIFAFDKGNSV